MIIERTFVPSSKFVGGTTVRTTVAKYVWKRKRGLTVHYKDGWHTRSEYNLRELLASGEVVEVQSARKEQAERTES